MLKILVLKNAVSSTKKCRINGSYYSVVIESIVVLMVVIISVVIESIDVLMLTRMLNVVTSKNK